jgi:L-Ala-D/L-Glu epimerase
MIMRIKVETFTVNKRFPLTISRGTVSQTTNIFVKIEEDGIEGWGEASPFSVGDRQSTEIIINSLQNLAPYLKGFSPLQRQEVEKLSTAQKIPSAARAALDIAMHDWLGKKVGLPLWQMWGLDKKNIVNTSVTIGINSPAGAQNRTLKWLEYADIKILKIKLGNPDGIEADKKMFLAVQEVAPAQELFVDANGGWNLSDAVHMCHWLGDLGIQYVEQPLAKGQEEFLMILKERLAKLDSARVSPLPIFVDESCFTSADIPQLLGKVDGVNIKLLKSGGLTEAMRMVCTAKASGLKVMFGCYSDSALLNTAAAQLAPLADYLDLDSHLNLIDDPFIGASFSEGKVLPNNLPGLGVQYALST